MGVLLKNQDVTIEIDLPEDNYQFSRFDWSGKIVNASYKGHSFAGFESLDRSKDSYLGRGFYNEFGIQAPLGFNESPIGSWCHKIGVGLLRKERQAYNFLSSYELQPILYRVYKNKDQLKLHCQSSLAYGYAYQLDKTITLHSRGFEVHYTLENTGSKKILTTEYNHNFIAIKQSQINEDYILKFPFNIDPNGFDEFVNPEQKIIVEQNRLGFKSSPFEEYFIANISGGQKVKAQWSLEHQRLKLGLTETGNFMTEAINLWGKNHVISPELFLSIDIAPGEKQDWTRNYEFYQLE